MKHIRFIVLLLMLLLLLGACKSGSEFRVINNCSYPTYVALEDGELQTIPGGKEYTFKVDTETQTFLTGEISRRMKVRAFGQTYSLINDISQPQQDTTFITLKAGKILKAYLHPNRACVMIQNNRSSNIPLVEIWRYYHNSIERQKLVSIQDIASGEETWERVLPMAKDFPERTFYYVAHIFDDIDAQPQIFGDPDNILHKDERWVLTLD